MHAMNTPHPRECHLANTKREAQSAAPFGGGTCAQTILRRKLTLAYAFGLRALDTRTIVLRLLLAGIHETADFRTRHA